jgi:hypothetical protein
VSWLELPSFLAQSWQSTAKLLTTSVQNTAWIDTDGPPGACSTSKHHSLDPYGGHEMVQQKPKTDKVSWLELPPILLRSGFILPFVTMIWKLSNLESRGSKLASEK